jgi:hypothetical protein
VTVVASVVARDADFSPVRSEFPNYRELGISKIRIRGVGGGNYEDFGRKRRSRFTAMRTLFFNRDSARHFLRLRGADWKLSIIRRSGKEKASYCAI